jgi:hypothetical protein
MADLPGMAGRTIDLSPQAPAPPGVAPANPLTSMLSPPQDAMPLSREDDARPLVPLAPARPPLAVAAAPGPRVPAPRPQQMVAAPPKQPALPARNVQPPPRQIATPLPFPSAPPRAQPQYVPPQRMAAAPTSTSSIPRPPASVGGVMLDVQQTPNTNSGSGNFFENLFGRR